MSNNKRPIYGTRDITKKKKLDPKQVNEAHKYLESMNKIKINDFWEEIRDGVILCNTVNVIKPGTCKKFKKSKIAYVCRTNIQIFLEGCGKLGIPEVDLFESRDLYDQQDLSRVVVTIYQLSAISRIHGFKGPFIGVKYHTSNYRNFSRKILRGRSALKRKPRIYECGMIEGSNIIKVPENHQRTISKQVQKRQAKAKQARITKTNFNDIIDNIKNEPVTPMKIINEDQISLDIPNDDEKKDSNNNTESKTNDTSNDANKNVNITVTEPTTNNDTNDTNESTTNDASNTTESNDTSTANETETVKPKPEVTPKVTPKPTTNGSTTDNSDTTPKANGDAPVKPKPKVTNNDTSNDDSKSSAIQNSTVKVKKGLQYNIPGYKRSMDIEDPLNLDNYNLGQTIGTGSFGRVRIAMNKNNKKFYVVKMLKKKMLIRLKLQNSQMWEYKLLLMMEHPFVVEFHGMYQNNKYIYICLEFVHGGELWSLFKKKKEMFIEYADFYAAQMVLVLEYLHLNNIVYRDWKAENLLIDKYGYIKLIDFQFAKELKNGELTFTMCGTPEYIAPEILLNEGHSFSVDMWSLGVLLYEMLTGDVPFWDEDYLQIYYQVLTADVLWPGDYDDDSDDEYDEQIDVDPIAKEMIGLLLNKNANERITATELKKHKFFNKINFDNVLNKKIKPPWIPTLKNNNLGDISHFEIERFKNEDRKINKKEEEKLIISKDKDPFYDLFKYKKEIIVDKRKEIRKLMLNKMKIYNNFDRGIIENGILTFKQFIKLLNNFNLLNKYKNNLREIFYWIYHEKSPDDEEFDVNGILCKFIDLLCIDPNYNDLMSWIKMENIDFDNAIKNRIEDNLDSIIGCINGEYEYDNDNDDE